MRIYFFLKIVFNDCVGKKLVIKIFGEARFFVVAETKRDYFIAARFRFHYIVAFVVVGKFFG